MPLFQPNPAFRQQIVPDIFTQARQQGLQESGLEAQIAKMQAQAKLYGAQAGQVGQIPPLTALQQAQMMKILAEIGQMGKQTPLQEAQTKKTIAETGQIGQPAPKFPEERELTRAKTEQARRTSSAEQIANMKLKLFRDNPGLLLKTLLKQDLTGPERLRLGNQLRGEFNSSKIYKNFLVTQRSERAMHVAYQEAIRGDLESKVGADQALAVMFQKMLDPDSVVRESEYARTPEGVGVLQRISSYVEKWQKGGLAISDADRAALYDIAKKLLVVEKQTMNELIERYTMIAKDYGIEPKLIFGNIKKFNDKTTQTFQEIYNALPSGATYTAPDGTQRTKK